MIDHILYRKFSTIELSYQIVSTTYKLYKFIKLINIYVQVLIQLTRINLQLSLGQQHLELFARITHYFKLNFIRVQP